MLGQVLIQYGWCLKQGHWETKIYRENATGEDPCGEYLGQILLSVAHRNQPNLLLEFGL